MPSRDYFGPGPHGCTNTLHPLSLEHRARHEKSYYMSYPNHTVDYLMDDMGHRTRNAYANTGGNAMIVMVDVDGKVAYNDKQDSPENWVPSEIMGRGLVKVRSWQVPLMNWQMLRTTTLQRELHAVLANGGKAVPSGKRPLVLGELQFTLEGAKIMEVNPTAQTVALKGKSWNAPEPLTLTLSVTGTTRLVRRDWDKPVAARLADFRVSQTISAACFPGKDDQSGRALAGRRGPSGLGRPHLGLRPRRETGPRVFPHHGPRPSARDQPDEGLQLLEGSPRQGYPGGRSRRLSAGRLQMGRSGEGRAALSLPHG
ncbi:MAG: hypothetical protein FJ290_01915 [Planctomycetes bacterium]|nr:hypothetical protein [Planctomycetota bacterium]